MAKIQEVAGLISETLQLDPIQVQRHVEGLRAAGRLSGSKLSVDEMADVLCACLSSDPVNATGPYHLLFTGAFVATGPHVVETGSPEFAAMAAAFPDFGSTIAQFIKATIDGGPGTGAVRNIQVAGKDDRLRAYVLFDAFLFGHDCKPIAVFGYEPIMPLLQRVAVAPGYLETWHGVGGQIIDKLGSLCCADPVVEKVRTTHASIGLH